MNAVLSHVLAVGFGVIVAAAGFVWLNVKKPEDLDAAEAKVRTAADKVKKLKS